ncbi:SDR family NAD(P)-dependent oxidoreductase [Gramella sp. KN1008]|uniref:SDR family NAD(P)-dependent oxidoreductase n=1 Tax=Gramella sp. KN1008 TaxID=2529298 RepID=UPI00104048A0|nr:SDR family NAD(P)-dependent oxidoreductase [Gramella sp. KN1008]TBW26550.1 SDR family NAD(P)-dependent oxidoreductase [Gramella sp. KN1008]
MQKKAIIIGASSGIGRGLAKRLTEEGIKVGITGRRLDLLLDLQRENPEAFEVACFDVTELETSILKLQLLVEEMGGLDMLILSSGVGELNDKLNFENDRNAISTNIAGFTNILNWAFKFFQDQKYGHIVAISSIGGLRGSRRAPSYSASKAYQINYLESLRQSATYNKLPIIITDVRPGFVDTAMAKGEGLFWVVPVKKAAKQIYDAIRAEKKVVYISKRWRIIASVYKNIPSILYNKM